MFLSSGLVATMILSVRVVLLERFGTLLLRFIDMNGVDYWSVELIIEYVSLCYFVYFFALTFSF